MHRVSKITNHPTHKGGYCFTMLIALGMILFSHTTSLFAVQIDHSKMRRDLDIAEEALKHILEYRAKNTQESPWFDADQIKSTYIENYGIVFVVKSSLREHIFENLHHSNNKESSDKSKPQDASNSDAKTEYKERLIDFIKTYGTTLGQLKDRDRISIISDTQQHGGMISIFKTIKMDTTDVMPVVSNKSDTITIETDHLETKKVKVNVIRSSKSEKGQGVRIRMVAPDSIAQIDTLSYEMIVPRHMKRPRSATFATRNILYVSVQKADLNAYQRQSISDTKLKEKIVFQTISPDTALIKKIDILSSIFDTSLGLNPNNPLETKNQTLGAYIPHQGALFFVSNNQYAFKHASQNKTHQTPTNLIETLIETLADYGATLHDVKPNEDILIHFQAAYPLHHVPHTVLQAYFSQETTFKGPIHKQVDYTKTTNNESPQSLTLRVQKEHLTDYAVGKINLEKLRDKITITEY